MMWMERSWVNIVKLLRKLNLPFSLKKSLSANRNFTSSYISTLLLASLFGTYADLFFVGKQMYEFPITPFSNVFTINIVFTLAVIPLYTFSFLYLSNRMTALNRFILIVLLSLLAPLVEMQLEKLGLFTHGGQWKHYYSFVGYMVFMFFMWRFFKWRLMGSIPAALKR